MDLRQVTAVRPYEVDVDAFPVEEKPAPDRHARITWDRLMKHGHTRAAGCMEGHSRHSSTLQEVRRAVQEGCDNVIIVKGATAIARASRSPANAKTIPCS